MSKRNGKSGSKAITKVEATVVPLEDASEDTSADIASLPLWQRRIVGLVQSGVKTIDAAAQCNVSPSSVERFTKESPAFAQALTDAEAGVALMGVEASRNLAIAHASAMIEDAVKDSRDPSVKDGARLGNRRFVGEAASLIQSRNAPGAAIQINVFESGSLSQHLTELRAASKERTRLKEQERDGGTPDGG